MLIASPRSLVAAAVCSLVFAVGAASVPAATITLNSNRDVGLLRTTTANTATVAPFLVQQFNDVNLGGSPVFQVGVAGGAGVDHEVRSLVSFDHTPIPEYASIDAVTLRLYFRSTNSVITGATPFTVRVHAVSAANADWVEGTGLGNGAVTDNIGATWNRKNEVGPLNWAGGTGTPATGGLLSAGVDYTASMLASYSFNSLPADGTPIDFIFTGTSAQLTNLIDSWSVANGGFLLSHPNPASLTTGNTRVFFHSKEGLNPLWAPQLIIEFSPRPPRTFEPAAVEHGPGRYVGREEAPPEITHFTP